MASVQETKDALEVARDEAMKTTELAIDAINTVIAFSQWSLGILGVSIAVLGLIGVTLLYRNGLRLATRVANERLDSYLDSDSFRTSLDAKLEQVAKERWQNIILLQNNFQPPDRQQGEVQPFEELGEDNQ